MSVQRSLGQVVGDYDGRRVDPRTDLLEQPVHRGPELRVECAERLVEQEDLGAGGQRAGERDALLLTAGELTRTSSGEVGEVGEQQRLLEHHRDPPALGRSVQQAAPTEPHVTPLRPQEPRHHAQERALARSGGPDDSKQVGRRDIQGDVVERVLLPVGVAETDGLQSQLAPHAGTLAAAT